MKLIVGLGNPGSKYERTRHNIGFRTIDLLAQRHGAKMKNIKFKGLYEKLKILGEDVVLLKPHTYMNDSGISVKEAADFFKIPSKDIVVVYDDIDIPFGTLRIKGKGSSGSHNGMKSIIYHVQKDDFPRVRLSIGQRPSYMDLAAYVLQDFSNEEEKIVEKEIEAGADAIEEIISKDVNSAMNKFNGMNLNE